LASISLDKYVYSIGGCFGENSPCLNTVERYDVNENRWESLPGMKVGRYSCGVAVLNNRIYVIGGFGYSLDKNESIPLNHCEFFDPTNETWHDFQPLHVARGAASVIAAGGRIFCIGGYSGQYLPTVERYDPIEDRWTLCESLQNPRSGSGVGHINNISADDLFIM
jgi:N-acetylneuraminic acid mutarotase